MLTPYCSTNKSGSGEHRIADLISRDQAAACYIDSKFTGVDNSRVYHQMITLTDFMECFCRIAFTMEANKVKNSLSFSR